MASVVGFDEALAVVAAWAAKVTATEVAALPLLECSGRVLAENVKADRDQPPFDRSTRDGFAVRAGEVSAGGSLRVMGQVRAGEKKSQA